MYLRACISSPTIRNWLRSANINRTHTNRHIHVLCTYVYMCSLDNQSNTYLPRLLNLFLHATEFVQHIWNLLIAHTQFRLRAIVRRLDGHVYTSGCVCVCLCNEVHNKAALLVCMTTLAVTVTMCAVYLYVNMCEVVSTFVRLFAWAQIFFN